MTIGKKIMARAAQNNEQVGECDEDIEWSLLCNHHGASSTCTMMFFY